MYDINWAQRVYVQFCTDRTRTINIDNCIIQALEERTARKYTRLEIQKAILYSISSKKKQELWKKYKKLVKSTPFKKPEFDVVVLLVLEIHWLLHDMNAQLLLFT